MYSTLGQGQTTKGQNLNSTVNPLYVADIALFRDIDDSLCRPESRVQTLIKLLLKDQSAIMS